MTQDWQELSRELVYDGYRKIEKVNYRLPNGQVADFDIRRDGLVADILPITKNNEVVCIRQFRPGPNRIVLELPSGHIDDGEEPVIVAARELLEETGYAGEIKLLAEFVESPYSTMTKFVFLAVDCEKVSEQDLGELETIEVELTSLSDFREKLKSGELIQARAGYMGLDYLNLL